MAVLVREPAPRIAGSLGPAPRSIRFQDAMPRCSMFVTHPNAIIGQASIVEVRS